MTRRIAAIQAAAATGVGALGAVVLLVGWFGGVDLATRFLPDLDAMKANTAVAFVLLGIATRAAGHLHRTTAARLSAAGVAAIGLATTIQYGFVVDLGIDELLAADVGAAGEQFPGRMGLNTAIALILMAASVIGGSVGTHAGRVVEQAGVALTAFLAILSVSGAVYGVTTTGAPGGATEMTTLTALAFLLACTAMIGPISTAGPLRVLHSPFAGGRATRRLLPSMVGLLILVALGVELLARLGLVDQLELTLALTSTLSIAVVIVSFLIAAVRLDQADRAEHSATERAVVTSREIASLLSVFSDRHYRLDGDGRVLSQHGDPVSQGAQLTERYPTMDLDRLLQQARTSTSARPTATAFRQDGDRGLETLEARAATLPNGELAVVIRDVTEEVAARDELAALNRELEARVDARTVEVRSANSELERSNRELEQFAYLASHDLKEPLRMVNSFVRKLADRYEDQLDDRGRQYISFATDGASRMEALIDSILQYSRTGRAAIEAETIDLDRLLEQVTSELRRRITEVDASVRIGPLPSVSGDPTLLAQVFANLIGNAIKFVPPGTVPTVVIEGGRMDGMAEITVDDNGIGIPPEFREQVFSVFKRLQARDAYEGTGIGLAIVHRVIERHHGTIEVQDSPLGGTRFRILLPASDTRTP